LKDKPDREITSAEHALGMSSSITRRDFVGGTLAATGMATLTSAAPVHALLSSDRATYNHAFNGPPFVGDYRYSNGNTWEVLSAAHSGIRDGSYEAAVGRAQDTGEELDLVIVGGGPAGLGGAYYFNKESGGSGSCLILDNHPIFGGEAKRNEFEVDGTRLIAPQGSNLLFTPSKPGDGYLYEELTDIGMPLEYEYAKASNTSQPLSFDRTNYSFLWLADQSDSVGFFNHKTGADSGFVRNPWNKQLQGTAFTPAEREALLRWKFDCFLPSGRKGEDLNRWLDSMSIEDYFSKELGLPPVVARYCDTVLGSAVGGGTSTCSAYIGKDIGLAGFMAQGNPYNKQDASTDQLADIVNRYNVNCFPGGNAYVARYFVKHLFPSAISGDVSPGNMIRGEVRFNELDRSDKNLRLRLNATVIRVQHLKSEEGKGVRVTYLRDGKAFSVRAKSVMMASGGWVNRRIVPDLPTEQLDAFRSFNHVPVLVANVALTNWRFLDKLGITACRWFEGSFGFSCNIRTPIQVDGYNPPLDPDKPIVMTFYAPIISPGLSAHQQGVQGRWTVFSTPFRDYENMIRKQMVSMFGPAGFDPARDIAGITLNRWGHAYVVPEPGFFYGRNGGATASDIIRQPFDRISFASSELRGLQNYRGAVYESKRAIKQLKPFFAH
jgi:spermidine dehydrogenase